MPIPSDEGVPSLEIIDDPAEEHNRRGYLFWNATNEADMTTPRLSDTLSHQLPKPESQEALAQLLARRELELAAALRMSEVFFKRSNSKTCWNSRFTSRWMS